MLMSESPSTSPQFELQLMGGFGLRCRGHSPDPIIISSKRGRSWPMSPCRNRCGSAASSWLRSRGRSGSIARPARTCAPAWRRCATISPALPTMRWRSMPSWSGSRPCASMRVSSARWARRNAAGEIEDAASLYRGPFLSDLALEGEAFYAWASAERARLDADAGTVLSMLVGRAEDAGDAGRAAALAARLIAIDPFREDWLRLSLRVTARHLGRDKALLQARDFVDLLKKELDVAPEPATVALIERLKSGAGVAAGKSDVAFAAPIGKAAPPLLSPDRIAARPGSPVARAGRPPSGADICDRRGGSGTFDRRGRRCAYQSGLRAGRPSPACCAAPRSMTRGSRS